ncbi:lysozyme inhibitor LprI family protein [Methylorubrum suomiense]|uniref:hypothetical protein n=1 Tax=Methylorubrum suomiense TaxID=144191 RepID=UPI0010F8461A|nr:MULTISPECIES: hypothetical protein [Methylobacteriaceae]
MSKNVVGFLITSLVLLSIPAHAKTSFTCNKATRSDEIAICSNENLAKLELTSAILFRYSVGLLGKDAALILAQGLMRERRLCGRDPICLEKTFIKGIKYYKDAINGQYEFRDYK